MGRWGTIYAIACRSQFTAEATEPGGEKAELVLALPKAEKDTPSAMCISKAIADFDTVGALRKAGIYRLALMSTWGATDRADSVPSSG